LIHSHLANHSFQEIIANPQVKTDGYDPNLSKALLVELLLLSCMPYLFLRQIIRREIMINFSWPPILMLLLLTGCGGASYTGSPRDYRVDSARNYRGAADVVAEMRADDQFNTESYDEIIDNDFIDALTQPQSTFAVDVDTASYSNVRRMLNEGKLPPRGAVRIEELINYFTYDYPQPSTAHPFSVSTDVAGCPWNERHQLVRIALQGRQLDQDDRPASNLVFLLDVSGSMDSPDKLPLVKSAMHLLVEQLSENDRVAIVVYASGTGVVLPSTSADHKATILAAIDNLSAGGSTDGGKGIQSAYRIARDNFITGGTNRVILCTDGDFNVGITNQSDLIDLIQAKAKEGTFLSVLGFGTGNLQDSTMEKLADKGNGNYAYIDSLLEARRALVQQMGATLVTIAKDVKVQVDFNPQRIEAYRLIGYENRVMANRDFRDDTKDAGEIGAGHRVTALYEIIPVGSDSKVNPSVASAFVEVVPKKDVNPETLLIARLRYKEPAQEFSVELNQKSLSELPAADLDFQFASSVAAYGMLLRKSKHAGVADWDWVVQTAERNQGEDRDGFRAEFVGLAKRARMISQ
jgi:Ca-activated chloride channel family protein